MALISFIKTISNQISIYFKINLFYPAKYKSGKIASPVPENFFSKQGLIIQKNVVIHNWEEFELGDYTFIGADTFIDHCISIGKFCSISNNTKIGLRNHPLNLISTSPYLYQKKKGIINEDLFDDKKTGPAFIGNDVLISANSIILCGVKIGNGAVVGASSFVNKDVPPYAIVGGIPAKVLGYRFDEETISKLQKSEWWNWPLEKINNSKLIKDPASI